MESYGWWESQGAVWWYTVLKCEHPKLSELAHWEYCHRYVVWRPYFQTQWFDVVWATKNHKANSELPSPSSMKYFVRRPGWCFSRCFALHVFSSVFSSNPPINKRKTGLTRVLICLAFSEFFFLDFKVPKTGRSTDLLNKLDMFE